MSRNKKEEKKAAKKEITKNIRDLLNFKITVPLGNPSYKLLHTNQFITEFFRLRRQNIRIRIRK